MALFNNFPYSNTEEINLDYTLNKLNELYSRGENLYAELQSWRTATDEANEAWKSDLLSNINEWQNSVTHSLEEWKSSVDSEVANALTTLSNQITTELNQAKTDLRNEVADLASAAAASASDAAASQSTAAQSAQTAVNSAAAAAQSERNISESAEQIETNTQNISANTQQIQTNTQNISANTQQIRTNTQDISANTQQIQTNTQNISANTQQIRTNTQDIADNTQQIQTNTQNISANTQQIQTNTQNISANTQQIQTNTQNISANTQQIDIFRNIVQQNSILVTKSGDTVTLTDNIPDVPLDHVVVDINAIQDGTGPASPTNIRPIHGFNEIIFNQNDTANTIDVSAGAGTVYGGTVDLTSGTVTIDRVMTHITGTEDNSRYTFGSQAQGYVQFFRLPHETIGVTSGSSRAAKVFSDKLRLSQGGAYANQPQYSFRTDNDGHCALQLFSSDELSTRPTPESTKLRIVAMNGIDVVYYLKDTITFTIDPLQIVTQINDTYYANSGDVTISYYANAKLYMDNLAMGIYHMIAPVETNYVATRNYTLNNLVIVNGTLYRATTRINTGARLIVDTNIVIVNISDMINQ